MLIDAIYTLLRNVNENVYPGVTDQEIEAPFIVHSQSSNQPTPTKDGESTKDKITYKIASYDTTQTGAQVQAQAVRTYIDEYSGIVGGNWLEKIRFFDEENGYDEEAELFYTLQTYTIWLNYVT